MKNIARQIVFALTTFSATLMMPPASAQETIAAQEANRSNWITWSKRPWEMRYVVHIEKLRGWKNSQQLARETDEKSRKERFRWEQFFEPRTVLRIPHWELARKPEKADYPEDLAVVVIEFDKDGWVTTPNSFGKPLRGRLNSLWPGYMLLSAGEQFTDPTSTLGNWFVGLNEDTADGVTPALCNLRGTYVPINPRDESYTYGAYYDVKESWISTPPFSCREWSWQMQAEDRPYIDVTSYIPKEPQHSYPHGSYILPFIGWSRFDRQKPVIGKHANTWYCLHECPKGETPGPIANITAWAKANGWTPPKPPTRMPVFPDDPKRRGAYLP